MNAVQVCLRKCCHGRCIWLYGLSLIVQQFLLHVYVHHGRMVSCANIFAIEFVQKPVYESMQRMSSRYTRSAIHGLLFRRPICLVRRGIDLAGVCFCIVFKVSVEVYEV